MCERAGFSPRLAYTTDDMVVMQSLVAAGMGVTTIPGLALRAHRHPAITATRLAVPPRQIYAATYGDPPDPPATAASAARPGRGGGAHPRRVRPGVPVPATVDEQPDCELLRRVRHDD